MKRSESKNRTGDETLSRLTGFSTGALERGDYRKALRWLCEHEVDTVEISALRFSELKPLICDLDRLETTSFRYVSFHAPSSFEPEQEKEVVKLLEPVFQRGWNIVVHPDVIRKPALWRHFGSCLLIENMDRRKSVGRTVKELVAVFERLPEAKMCLDVAHARQLDTTLTLLFELIRQFQDRIAEIHISELDSHCRHVPMSRCAVNDYRSLPWLKALAVPVIIESMLDGGRKDWRTEELSLAKQALDRPASPETLAAPVAKAG